jgi:hypothetical protein
MLRLRLPFALLLCLFLAAACDARARVRFDNQSQCGTIKIRLTNTSTNAVIEHRLDNQSQWEVELEANTYYDYIVDFTAAGQNSEGYRCTALEEGKLRVPAGTTQTFRLESQKQ